MSVIKISEKQLKTVLENENEYVYIDTYEGKSVSFYVEDGDVYFELFDHNGNVSEPGYLCEKGDVKHVENKINNILAEEYVLHNERCRRRNRARDFKRETDSLKGFLK